MHGWKRKWWWTLGGDGGDPNIKKYHLNWDNEIKVPLPEGVTFIEMGQTDVTVHYGEPEVITSTMTRVPASWKGEGKYLRFNALRDMSEEVM